MKKHLIAAAVAAAVAVPAAAQVTVYGILDVGYTDREAATTTSGVTAATKQRSTGNTSAYTTSRLGFRGEEDLGGGLKAGFNYELGIAQNDATQTLATNAPVTGTTTTVDSNYGNGMSPFVLRQSNISLSGGFGSLTIGRQTTAVEAAWGAGDVGGSNNFSGRAYGFSVATAAAATDRSVGKQNNDRSDRIVQYRTPSMNGFNVTVQYGEGRGTLTNAKQKEQGIALAYSAGPLNVVYGLQKEKTQTVANANVNNGQPEQSVLGANYNLGPARVFVTWAEGENSDANGAKVDDRSLTEIGLSIPRGAVTFNVSTFDGDYKANAAAVKSDISGFQLAALYALSKRTTAYAVIGSDEIKNGTLATNVTKVKRDNMGIGLRHSF